MSIFRVRSLSLIMNFTCKTVAMIFSVYDSEVSCGQWGLILFGTGTELLILECPRPTTVDVFLTDTLSKSTCLFCFIKNSSWKLSLDSEQNIFFAFCHHSQKWLFKVTLPSAERHQWVPEPTIPKIPVYTLQKTETWILWAQTSDTETPLQH